jgi:hypothetical protein
VRRAAVARMSEATSRVESGPGYRFAHPGLYGVVVVKGDDRSGHGFAFMVG